MNTNGTTTNYLGITCGRTISMPNVQSILSTIDIRGRLNCNDTVCPKMLNYVVTDPNGTSTTPTSAGINQINGNFTIALPVTLFTSPGTYLIQLNGQCDQDTCPCVIKLTFKDCSCNSLQSQIAQGFQYSFNSTNCILKLKPKTWCPNDTFTWTISNGSSTQSYTSIGGSNVSIPIPFINPFNGFFTVCMTATRIVNGMLCVHPIPKVPYCMNFSIYCNKPKSFLCDTNAVKNGDFSEGNVTGELGNDGKIDGWSLLNPSGEGQVFIIDDKGVYENPNIVLIGNKDNPAGIWQKVSFKPGNYLHISYNLLDYSQDSIPAGTEIIIQLQKDSTFMGSTGAVKLIERRFINTADDTFDIPIIDSLPYNHTDELKYLAIYVQNQSDTEMSVIGIDDLEICISEDPIEFN